MLGVMMAGLGVLGMVAAVLAGVAAVLAEKCLREVRRGRGAEDWAAAAAAEESEGDGALREGLLNLMRYDPDRKEDKEG